MTGCSGNHPTSLGTSLGGSACSAGSGPALLLELLLAAACGGVAWRGRTRAMRAQSLSWLGSSAPRSLATWQGGPRVGRRDSLDHMRLRCRGGCSSPRTGSSMKPSAIPPLLGHTQPIGALLPHVAGLPAFSDIRGSNGLCPPSNGVLAWPAAAGARLTAARNPDSPAGWPRGGPLPAAAVRRGLPGRTWPAGDAVPERGLWFAELPGLSRRAFRACQLPPAQGARAIGDCSQRKDRPARATPGPAPPLTPRP